MIRVSVKKAKTAADEIQNMDVALAKMNEIIQDNIQQCKKLGLIKGLTRLMKASEDITKQRHMLQELVLSLDNIAGIYSRCEEVITDNLEGTVNRAARTTSWVEISFSKETMELINQISA